MLARARAAAEERVVVAGIGEFALAICLARTVSMLSRFQNGACDEGTIPLGTLIIEIQLNQPF
jgi:hypothetical protein